MILLLPFFCALVTAGAAYCAAGPSLGLIIGGYLAVALLVPPFVASQDCIKKRIASSAAIVAGVATAWLTLLGSNRASAIEWIEVTLVLGASAILLTAIASLCRRVGLSIAVTAAICTSLSIAWIAWPLWLSAPMSNGTLSSTAVAWLLRFHPILLSNGILTFTPPWTEQTIAYQLSILNQDVPINLPTNPGWFIGSAVILSGIVFVSVRRRIVRLAND